MFLSLVRIHVRVRTYIHVSIENPAYDCHHYLIVCEYGTFFCIDGVGGRSCLNYSRVCDGMSDCYNGTDETLLCGGSKYS